MTKIAIRQIQKLLVARQFKAAKEAIEAALKVEPDHAMLLAFRAALLMEFGEMSSSRAGLERASERAEHEGDQDVRVFAETWLGYLNNRLNNAADAMLHFERAVEVNPHSVELLAQLCQGHANLGNLEEARKWGQRSLLARDAEGSCKAEERVATNRPRKFDPIAREKNVLAFSLFGQDRFYYEGALTLARTSRAIFPEFTCWFYCSTEIPADVKRSLAKADAKVLTVNSTADRTPLFDGLFWRFLAFDDPEADLVLVRDVDSPFTIRERWAVDAWLASDQPFLTMRDDLRHTEPLMAGMWGGFTGLLPNIGAMIQKYRPRQASRYIDQEFLRLLVWPRIRNSTLSIDSNYELGKTLRFPKSLQNPNAWGVGSGWPRNLFARPTS